MQFCNADMITRRTLLELSLPLHFYIEHLLHTTAAIRELAKDTLQIVNTKLIAVNDYGAGTLPDDFVDEVGVYLPAGGELVPIPKKNSLTPLRQTDDTGVFIPYTTQSQQVDNFFFGGLQSGWGYWFWNVNEFGEPTGRFFGANGGVSYGYQIFRERRQIQFTDNFIGGGNIPMMYISNGQSVDNATQIDWRAFAAIQSYGAWKSSPNRDMKDSPQARTFYNEMRRLRAEMSDLTAEDIINIIRNSYTASIKN